MGLERVMSKQKDKPAAGNSEQSSDLKAKRLANIAPHKFQPGQSGNPSGRPKKKPLTELYEQILNDPAMQPIIRKAVKSAISRGQMAMVLQLREMAERVEGKVTQQVEVNGDLHLTLSERMAKAEERLKRV